VRHKLTQRTQATRFLFKLIEEVHCEQLTISVLGISSDKKC